MENKSKSSVVYQGKIPGRVKYSFAFGALDKNLIYGMIATLSMIYSWIYTLITQEDNNMYDQVLRIVKWKY